MTLYILRHGETDLHIKGVMQGWLDAPLNQNGRDLAVVTGQGMRGIRFDKCISSPLIRAKETAEIVLRESGNRIPITTDDRIREINFGEMEGRTVSEMGDAGALFFKDPFRFPGFPHGETISDVCKRTQSFLKELLETDSGETVLICTHGCATRAMLNFLYEDPAEFWRGHPPYNCSVNIVAAENKTARIVAEDKVYYDRHLIMDHYKR